MCSADGVPVSNLEDYAALLFGADEGQQVEIEVEREGERLLLRATLGTRR